jgi:hypothetical protein
MRHANTALQPDETRIGLTQYAAGALFRWVDSGFCKSEKATAEVRARMAAEAPIRFQTLLNLFSKLKELDHDRAKVSDKK